MMLKKAIVALSLSVSAFCHTVPISAQAATEAPAPVDAARLKLAERVVGKLVPPGTYSKIMNDMMDNMAGGLVEQMMGMDASVIAGMAGEAEGSDASAAVEGKSMAEIAAEKDPDFKERMDITMQVMFSEMGSLMSEMEPMVRAALANIYARKYSVKELSDMNTFFATPSGAAFAGNFMSTFTDKEMMQASFGMMPKMMEAMPAIMKKVEAATAHLPPLPLPDTETAVALDGVAAAEETGEEPWYNEDNWTPANRKKTSKLSDAYMKASGQSEAAYTAFDEAQVEAIDQARKRFLGEGWTAAPTIENTENDDEPMALEDIPADAVPPPALPK